MASVASVKRGERAGVTKGMRKREADWLKEARALVSTRQAHERTHARANPRSITKTHAQTRNGQGGNRRIQHTHTHTHTDVRTRASLVWH